VNDEQRLTLWYYMSLLLTNYNLSQVVSSANSILLISSLPRKLACPALYTDHLTDINCNNSSWHIGHPLCIFIYIHALLSKNVQLINVMFTVPIMKVKHHILKLCASFIWIINIYIYNIINTYVLEVLLPQTRKYRIHINVLSTINK
jgi:hypothetical protein